MLDTTLPKLLASLRERRGFSVADVGRRVGVARSTAYSWEATGRPGPETLGRLLKLYEATEEEELQAWRLLSSKAA